MLTRSASKGKGAELTSEMKVITVQVKTSTGKRGRPRKCEAPTKTVYQISAEGMSPEKLSLVLGFPNDGHSASLLTPASSSKKRGIYSMVYSDDDDDDGDEKDKGDSSEETLESLHEKLKIIQAKIANFTEKSAKKRPIEDVLSDPKSPKRILTESTVRGFQIDTSPTSDRVTSTNCDRNVNETVLNSCESRFENLCTTPLVNNSSVNPSNSASGLDISSSAALEILETLSGDDVRALEDFITNDGGVFEGENNQRGMDYSPNKTENKSCVTNVEQKNSSENANFFNSSQKIPGSSNQSSETASKEVYSYQRSTNDRQLVFTSDVKLGWSEKTRHDSTSSDEFFEPPVPVSEPDSCELSSSDEENIVDPAVVISRLPITQSDSSSSDDVEVATTGTNSEIRPVEGLEVKDGDFSESEDIFSSNQIASSDCLSSNQKKEISSISETSTNEHVLEENSNLSPSEHSIACLLTDGHPSQDLGQENVIKAETQEPDSTGVAENKFEPVSLRNDVVLTSSPDDDDDDSPNTASTLLFTSDITLGWSDQNDEDSTSSDDDLSFAQPPANVPSSISEPESNDLSSSDDENQQIPTISISPPTVLNTVSDSSSSDDENSNAIASKSILWVNDAVLNLITDLEKKAEPVTETKPTEDVKCEEIDVKIEPEALGKSKTIESDEPREEEAKGTKKSPKKGKVNRNSGTELQKSISTASTEDVEADEPPAKRKARKNAAKLDLVDSNDVKTELEIESKNVTEPQIKPEEFEKMVEEEPVKPVKKRKPVENVKETEVEQPANESSLEPQKKKKKQVSDTEEQLGIPRLPDHYLKDLAAVKLPKPKKVPKTNDNVPKTKSKKSVKLVKHGATEFSATVAVNTVGREKMAADFKKTSLYRADIRRVSSKSLKVAAIKRSF